MTFVVAAPLLSPYIIVLSFTALGPRYAVLRILSSFVLAATTGLVVAALFGRKTDTAQRVFNCQTPWTAHRQNCSLWRIDDRIKSTHPEHTQIGYGESPIFQFGWQYLTRSTPSREIG